MIAGRVMTLYALFIVFVCVTLIGYTADVGRLRAKQAQPEDAGLDLHRFLKTFRVPTCRKEGCEISMNRNGIWKKNPILLAAFIFIITVSCAAPIVAPTSTSVIINTQANTAVTKPIPSTEIPTATLEPTITPTATPVPDVELAQLQILPSEIIIAEIVNHLKVPVVFEDQKPAFEFDVYDPSLNQHWDEKYQVNRNGIEPVPCVLYPNEHAFFVGRILFDWSTFGGWQTDQLQITYRSLGVPRPDWTDNTTQPEIRNIQWNIQDHVLNFSFTHDPVTGILNYYHLAGSIGVYDQENHLLGVGWGGIAATASSGQAKGYWISLNGTSMGAQLGLFWNFIGPEKIDDKIDHINLLIENLRRKDGFCEKL